MWYHKNYIIMNSYNHKNLSVIVWNNMTKSVRGNEIKADINLIENVEFGRTVLRIVHVATWDVQSFKIIKHWSIAAVYNNRVIY